MSQKIKRVICAATLLTTCFGTFASTSAQEKTRKPSPDSVQIQKIHAEQDMVFHAGVGSGDSFTFIAADNMFGGGVVKGAPYSAQAITENIQVLSDGNRIVRKNTTAIYRDSEGRTRNDQTLGAIGPYSVQGDPAKTFFINDPVAGVHFVLEPNSKTARKMFMPTPDGPIFERKIAPSADGPETTVFIRGGQAGIPAERMREGGQVIVTGSTIDIRGERKGEAGVMELRAEGKPANLKTESLGTQTIEGVSAEGSRTTFTIPAGEIGNEQAINIVSETWFSPELKVLVMRKHSDPRNGEMVYRLTNINRTEPDRSLFEVPADYTVKESLSLSPTMRMKMDREREVVVRDKMKKEKNNQ
jgi:hypothetical protein